jgi:hypothetical protein
MERAGLNFYPGKTNFYHATNGLADLGGKNSKGDRLDCFDRISSSGGIRAGDLLVVSGLHVVMIDTVGRDPFGIAEMIEGENAWNWTHPADQAAFKAIRSGTSKQSNTERLAFLNRIATQLCTDELDPARFKVTIIHSSPHGNGVGIQREKAYSDTSYGVGLGHDSALLSALKLKAKAECIDQLREKWEGFAPGLKASTNAALASIRKAEATPGRSKVLRHASNEPGCRGIPAFDPAMHCADCCNLNSRYDEITGEKNASD